MNNLEDIKVAVIGAGRMGRIRAGACVSLGAKVVSICDPSEATAVELANELGHCDAITSEKDIPWDIIDAIFVCTPPVHRGPVESAALNRSLPFFVEKPIAVNASQVDPIVNRLQQASNLSAVGYQNRHRASLKYVKESIDQEKVLGFSAQWVGGAYKVPWWSQVSESGGAVNEQATHLLDMARYLLGEVTSVQAMSSDPASTSCVISLEFANDAVGSIFYSYGYSDKSIGISIFTSDRTLRLEGWDFRFEGEDLSYPEGDPSVAHRNAIFVYEVSVFLKAVCNKHTSTSLCDFADAYKSQTLVDQVVSVLENS